ncbi:MAG: C40 family peptidase [Paramuribaculum sp.]|nr:C40 family peptidase [Paramuribaculum sp.]MDE5921630.1 C40 family peptidase [Paramuribaculum sp.]
MKRYFYAFVILIVSILTLTSMKPSVNPPLKLAEPQVAEPWSLINMPQLLDLPADDAKSADAEASLREITDNLTKFASQFIGRRYVWGSTGPKTFDCSGFTSYIFRNAGVTLNRTSRMQYAQGEPVKTSELRPGDLMFFSSPRSGKGRVGHVAMVVEVDDGGESLTFIHAASSKGVSYQRFPDGGYYSRNYIGAKRVIQPENTENQTV